MVKSAPLVSAFMILLSFLALTAHADSSRCFTRRISNARLAIVEAAWEPSELQLVPVRH